MSQYFNRYQYFNKNGNNQIVPLINLPLKSTDKIIQYKKGVTRFDIVSQEYYGSPFFSWLIMVANPNLGSIEFEIPDNSLVRIPFPLVNSLQDYKNQVDLYKLYYGE